MIGRIKRFGYDTGYGFIRESQSHKDYYFHVTDSESPKCNIIPGVRVQFDTAQVTRPNGKPGVKAVHVRVL